MTTPRIAAVLYDRRDGADLLLSAFADDLARRGLRVVGLVEAEPGSDACLTKDMALRDLASGTVTSICQDLGAHARGCRIDPAGLAHAGALLSASLETTPDLVVVNKFGKLEADGLGLLDEIGRCVADERPLVIGVPVRFREAWDAFAGGLDAKLPCARAALDAWWAALEAETRAVTPAE